MNAPTDPEATPSPNETNGTSPTHGRPRHVQHRLSVWVVVAVVLLAAVAGFAVYHIATAPKSSPNTLTIWTYPSLFDYGLNPNQTRSEVFQAFANATGSTVNVVYIQGDLAKALEDAKPGTQPDLVMGLDELEAPIAAQDGLLVNYTSPQLAHVDPAVVNAIAPDHSVTPYEYGYLGLDYNLTSTPAPLVSALTQGDFFQAMASNPSLAANLYYPDPVQGDITGQEFLAWEVEYYTHVLHQNWTTFWQNVSTQVHPTPDWSTCWAEFTAGTADTCLSYLSDPASEAYFGAGGWMNTSMVQHGGRLWSWMTVYGTGIVRGTPHLTLAEKFIDWTLSGTVQNLVPTNEWEYPANSTVALPGVYNWTTPASEVTPLNSFTTPEQSSSELISWVLQLAGIVA